MINEYIALVHIPLSRNFYHMMFRLEVLLDMVSCNLHVNSILEDFENASSYFYTFLATVHVYAIEKLLAGFNVHPRIGMNQSLF